jgi:hypothetical protein
VQWSRGWLAGNPGASGDEYVAELAYLQNVEWSIPMLRICWDVLTEKQRLIFMRNVPDWALKVVAGWAGFPGFLGSSEREYLRDVYVRRGSLKTVELMDG